MPVMLGLISVNASLSTSWIWLTVITLNTLFDHSGYHLPFLQSPEQHDFHHLKFAECYGFNGFLDTFHNTRQSFDKTVHALRHKTLFTFKAANELYPDINKKSQ
jgi:fatty acid hydroxylase domain-containing protein 2